MNEINSAVVLNLNGIWQHTPSSWEARVQMLGRMENVHAWWAQTNTKLGCKVDWMIQSLCATHYSQVVLSSQYASKMLAFRYGGCKSWWQEFLCLACYGLSRVTPSSVLQNETKTGERKINETSKSWSFTNNVWFWFTTVRNLTTQQQHVFVIRGADCRRKSGAWGEIVRFGFHGFSNITQKTRK